MTLPLVLTALAALAGGLHIRAEYAEQRAQVYLFKPAVVSLLLLMVLLAPGITTRYHAAIAIGLACSIAGDVFLMLPGDQFLRGVAAFLFAHCAYFVAFTAGLPLGARPLLLVPYALASAAVLAAMWQGLGFLRFAVALYVAVITVMGWQAAARWAVLGTGATALAAAGAVLFLASDAALAINRFRKPYRSAVAVIHVTYAAAQMLIAWSCLVPGQTPPTL
jgi:uncharacterized membrane protein YhhN